MPQHKPLPPREWLLENLRYEPETGLFYWVDRSTRWTASEPAGCKTYSGRNGEPEGIIITIQKKIYRAHRLAWHIATGQDPGVLTIDHVNRDPFDNRLDNLRLADSSLQTRNQRARGASAHKGVYFNKAAGKWKAVGRADGRQKYLGYFATEAEAAAAAAPYFIH